MKYKKMQNIKKLIQVLLVFFQKKFPFMTGKFMATIYISLIVLHDIYIKTINLTIYLLE